MKRAVRWLSVWAGAAWFALAAGCSVDSNFAYRPDPPTVDARKLPVNVAVLPFTDGTENFTKRGPAAGDGQYNLAKAGISGGITAMPPEFWGKSFADELAASGSFRSVRFIYNTSELGNESYVVDGVLRKVLFWSVNPGTGAENEILVSFRAVRRSDNKPAWETEVKKEWQTPKGLWAGCAVSKQCYSDKLRAHWNGILGDVLAEARKDLVAKIAPQDDGTGDAAGAKPAGAASGGSVERTIERILKGK